jgi:transposase-like protein
MNARAVPFHCPYCGEEDLRPSEEGHGSWECHACLRAFSVKMLGQLRNPTRVADPLAPVDVESS